MIVIYKVSSMPKTLIPRSDGPTVEVEKVTVWLNETCLINYRTVESKE